MSNIPQNFCGYLDFDGNKPIFFSVTNHTVKLLPEFNEINHFSDSIEKQNDPYPNFLYGIDEDNFDIAFLQRKGFSLSPFGVMLNSSVSFPTPLIVKGTSNTRLHWNMFGDWNKFDAIIFSGGAINELYNPKIAALKLKYKQNNDCDVAQTITVKPSSEFTHSCDIEMDGEKAKLVISVSQTGAGDTRNTSLGDLISFVRLEFENTQDFSKIERYYVVINSMFSILSVARNITFDMALCRKHSDGKFAQTAVCKVYRDYKGYSNRKYHNVIQLDEFMKQVPFLVKHITSDSDLATPLLNLLPINNRTHIDEHDIPNLCAALEVAYKQAEHKKSKDDLISALEESIKKTITQFSEEHSDFDAAKQTTVSSALKHLDWSAANKVLYLYKEHEDAIMAVVKQLRISCLVDEKTVGKFIKLRNTKTHTGKVSWDDSVQLYVPLLALVYACMFKKFEIDNDNIKKMLLKIF